MESLDAIAGESQRVEGGGIAGLHRGFDLGRCHPQRGGIDVEPVELGCRLDQRGVTALGDIVDDGARGGLDVGGDLALGGEKLPELAVEIGAGSDKANGKCTLSGNSFKGPLSCSMARERGAVNPRKPSLLSEPVALAGVPCAEVILAE